MTRPAERETGTAMWAQLVKDTFQSPRAAARRLMALDLGGDTLVQGALVVTCLGMVLTHFAGVLAGAELDPVTSALLASPLLGALVQLGGMLLAVVLTWKIGQLFGGGGDLAGAFRVLVWLNAVLLLLQAAQLLVMVVAPPFAVLISILGMVWMLWAFASFTAELHGFRNAFVVAGVTMLTAVVLLFTLMMLLAMIGVNPQGAV